MKLFSYSTQDLVLSRQRALLSFKMLLTCFATGILISACSEITEIDRPGQSVMQADEARSEFAKAFVKAISKDTVLRQFIKAEAMRVFDGDCDIFFHAQKNKMVHSGKTLSQLISQESTVKDFDEMVNSLPLLNILVPMNRKANAWTWEPRKEVPLVVALNSKAFVKGSKTVTVFDKAGISSEIDAFNEPDNVVIVIEDSERIELEKSGTTPADPKSLLVPYFYNQGNQYYFIGDRFISNSMRQSSSARIPSWWGDYIRGYTLNYTDYIDPGFAIYSNMWNKLPEVFIRDYSAQYSVFPANQPMRRSINYTKDGTLNANAKDRLMYFKFQTFSDAVTAADGWTESSIEIEFNLFFGAPQNGSTFEAEYRRFSAPPMTYAIEDALNDPNPINQLAFQQMRDDLTAQGYITTIDNTFTNSSQGIWANAYAEMLNWSPFKYGDKMQYVFRERDGGTEHTYEANHTSGFSTSFDAGVKDIWKFNISTNYSTGTKLTYKYKDDSDPLASVTLDYNETVGFARPSYDASGMRFILQVK